jgi:hypothetical protein
VNRKKLSRRRMLKASLASTLAFTGEMTAARPSLLAFNQKLRSTVRLPKLFRVPLGMQTGRLHEMEPGYDDGCLWFWAGGIGDTLLQYDSRSGRTTRHPLIAARHPENSQTLGRHFFPLAKAGKVYLADLRQPSNFLPVYHPHSRKITFHKLPETQSGRRMSLYKGHAPKTGPFLYLFPKDPSGVIQWDTRTDTGRLFRFPYGARGPWYGKLSGDGKTLWCPLWDANAMARFDVASGKWTGHWPSPFEKAQPTNAGMIGDFFYAPDIFKPRVLCFDTANESWLEAIKAPGYRTHFGILGGGFIYQQMMFCAMSTYKGYSPPGGPLGIDGKPHHFLDCWLCYDPLSKRFAHLVCRAADREYWLTCYAVELGQHLYITAFNAMQADGSIRQASRGDAAIFQTHPIGRSAEKPVWEDVPAV